MHRQTEAKPACSDLHKLCSKCCQNVSHNLWQLASADMDERRMGGGMGAGSSEKEELGWEWVWLAKCWLGVCFGQTTEYTERENGLHSSSPEVQTVPRAKFSYILCAQDDTHAHTPTMFSGADNPGTLPAYYCEFQLSARVHAALVVSCHVETHM